MPTSASRFAGEARSAYAERIRRSGWMTWADRVILVLGVAHRGELQRWLAIE